MYQNTAYAVTYQGICWRILKEWKDVLLDSIMVLRDLNIHNKNDIIDIEKLVYVAF